jgi:hypothetical protein
MPGRKHTKLTVRIRDDVLQDARAYAREHDTTLSRLVTEHLERLRHGNDPLADAPTTRRLVGVLPPRASVDEYRAHLQRKHR